MGRGDSFGLYNYASDNTKAYVIKLSAAVAGQGGFTAFSGSIQGALFWPFHVKYLRHVWGIASTGERARIPISAAGNAKYTTGGTFSLGGKSYIIQGAIGEARKLNTIG